MKQNYIDGKGNYHNELNYTLAQIYDSGVEFGCKVTAQGIIEELEKIKAEIENIRDVEVTNGTVYVSSDDVNEILDSGIAELKGE